MIISDHLYLRVLKIGSSSEIVLIIATSIRQLYALFAEISFETKKSNPIYMFPSNTI